MERAEGERQMIFSVNSFKPSTTDDCACVF
jgi:hypothetical protein